MGALEQQLQYKIHFEPAYDTPAISDDTRSEVERVVVEAWREGSPQGQISNNVEGEYMSYDGSVSISAIY